MGAVSLKIEDILARVDELPTLPTVVYELSQVISDPMSSTNEVERIMSRDQALTAKVLKLVNSAYYAIPGGVTSVSRAIAYLGFDTVHQLVLATSILDVLDINKSNKFSLSHFWKHSLGVAVASETIAKYIRHPVPADVFTCGLVHDMGKVVLYTLVPDSLIAIVETARDRKISFMEAEEDFVLPRHTTIGHLLSQKWGLPSTIQASVKYHHQFDTQLRGTLSAGLQKTVDIVILANLLTHALKFGNSGHDIIVNAPKEVLERLTITPDHDLKNILVEIKKGFEGVQDFLIVLGL